VIFEKIVLWIKEPKYSKGSGSENPISV